ncbi:MAG: 30S ribosomal protein S2 [Bacteroidetes bacterium]|nr:30S ribosomal protein S2 [Bacteroidota bacterium]
MSRVSYDQLLEAGAHFGHLKSKWNPKMAPYIFMESRGIHIIDLNKTVVKLDEAAAGLKQIAKSGRKILFVATKKQAKEIVSNAAKKVGMPYITERWPGGMLTNFATVRKSVKKMTGFDKMATDGTFENISKKERLQITRQKAKMEHFLGSITDLTRLPAAIFIVDIMKEHIAVAEAQKLNIPTFAITDTNTDPTQVDFAIPANDDATKSIGIIVDVMVAAIEEGLGERKMDKDAEAKASEEEVMVEAKPKEIAADDEEVAAVTGIAPETIAATAAGKRPRKKKVTE